MKADQLARHYAKQTAKLVALETEVLYKQLKEYSFLYRAVYNLTTERINPISYKLYGDKAYVVRLNYVDFLRDLALIRYKFSRKKYKGGKRKNENQIP